MLQIAIDYFVRVICTCGYSMIMSVDDKSNPLVCTQIITSGRVYSLLGKKVPQVLNLPCINVGKLGIKSFLHHCRKALILRCLNVEYPTLMQEKFHLVTLYLGLLV